MPRLWIALAAMMSLAMPAWAQNDATRPDPNLTPGAVRTTDVDAICNSGSTREVRHVTEREAMDVYNRYGLQTKHEGQCAAAGCEVDHLISLELGGSNDITNLWPEPYDGEWNAHVKDHLENFLHARICDGTITPQDAQAAISSDWIAAFKKYLAEPVE